MKKEETYLTPGQVAKVLIFSSATTEIHVIAITAYPYDKNVNEI